MERAQIENLSEIIGCLKSATAQSAPSDDQIIMGCIKEALSIAETMRRAARRRPEDAF